MKLWVARDTQGSLTLHYIKPEPWAGCGWNGGIPMWLESDMFPEVTFENSPMEVELKLKNELSFEETEELIDDLI